ncbi:MAG: glycoside hydrolase [Oscillospiraceae bacterium]|nr:glycoside hydrolase [Oscillospiraceae bacterium]
MKLSKILSAVTAFVLTFGSVSAVNTEKAVKVNALPADGVKYEFEDGAFDNCKAESWTKIDECASGNSADISDWSGTGFANITEKGSSVTVTVEVEEDGLYEVLIRYCQCFDMNKKVQYLNVNGVNQGEVSFPYGEKFEEMSAGYVPLKAGKNEIQIKGYWGYTMFDYLVVKDADPSVSKLDPERKLSNPNANDTTKRLFSYLCDIYGKNILSGQQEYCGSHSYNLNANPDLGYIVDNELEFEYILEETGEMPAIRGIDFLNYSSADDMWDDNAAERTAEWVNKFGGIATVTYHWSMPSDPDETGRQNRFFYVESASASYTTFSISKALEEGTWENEILMADIEFLASKLQLLEDADVPVLWRPLHEAEGAWFWWGAEGPENCKKLYRLLYDQLTNVYGLDNLIWVWTGYTFPTSPQWYPGDEYVDIVGYDKYNAVDGMPNLSSISSTFYNLVASTDGNKMVTMSENDSIPSLDNLLEDKAGWLWFCPWYNNYLTSQQINPVDELVKIYQSEYCITLDELPDLRKYPINLSDGVSSEDPDATTPPTTTDKPSEKVVYGDLNKDGKVDLSDLTMLSLCLLGDTKTTSYIEEVADVNGDGSFNIADLSHLKQYISKDPVVLGPQ